MIIKPCKEYKGYFADSEGGIYSGWKNIGGAFQLTDKPVKRISQFLESGKKKRTQPRKFVWLNIDGKKIRRGVHQLVCDAFHKKTDPSFVVLHKSDITSDNRASNLMWGSKQINIKQREANNLKDNIIRELTEKLNKYKYLYGEIS